MVAKLLEWQRKAANGFLFKSFLLSYVKNSSKNHPTHFKGYSEHPSKRVIARSEATRISWDCFTPFAMTNRVDVNSAKGAQ